MKLVGFAAFADKIGCSKNDFFFEKPAMQALNRGGRLISRTR